MLYVILPSLIITGIFVLIFLITFIQQWLRGSKLSEQLAETRAEIEETLDSYGEETEADVPEAYSDPAHFIIGRIPGSVRRRSSSAAVLIQPQPMRYGA